MESESITRTIETGVHGRYLVRVPQAPGPWPALFSFHGYGEDAATNMTALHRIPDVNGWLLVAVQALHPFYTKSERVVASWMTRQDRELAIADNLAYVTAVVEAVQREFEVATRRSRSRAFRRAALWLIGRRLIERRHRAAGHLGAGGVIVLAADVPPDVSAPGSLPSVLIGRGRADAWYTEEKMAADLDRLAAVAASVETCVFDGGHEWTDAFASAAGAFLNRIQRCHAARRRDALEFAPCQTSHAEGSSGRRPRPLSGQRLRQVAPDVAAQTPTAPPAVDETLALVNGRIHTMDARNTVARAVTIRNGRFVSVGDTAPRNVPNMRDDRSARPHGRARD